MSKILVPEPNTNNLQGPSTPRQGKNNGHYNGNMGNPWQSPNIGNIPTKPNLKLAVQASKTNPNNLNNAALVPVTPQTKNTRSSTASKTTILFRNNLKNCKIGNHFLGTKISVDKDATLYQQFRKEKASNTGIMKSFYTSKAYKAYNPWLCYPPSDHLPEDTHLHNVPDLNQEPSPEDQSLNEAINNLKKLIAAAKVAKETEAPKEGGRAHMRKRLGNDARLPRLRRKLI